MPIATDYKFILIKLFKNPARFLAGFFLLKFCGANLPVLISFDHNLLVSSKMGLPEHCIEKLAKHVAYF